MTHVLALDTATDVVTVAIGRDAEPLAALRVASGREHAERLVPAIRTVVEQSGVGLDRLAAIAVGIGPGRFTGLRVGVTTAKVMAHALRIPIVGIGSLDLVAYPLRHTRRDVVAVIDARRREVFWARYRTVPGGLERWGDEGVDPPHELVAELEASGRDVLLAGDGVLRYRDVFATLDRAELAGPEHAAPSALALLELATGRVEREEFVPPHELVPVYLRESDAAINWERAELGVVVVITEPLTVVITPMRRRHVRSVLRIEEQVYPRPWTSSLFLSELALRSTRAYFVARVGRELVGYAGIMISFEDAHVTTIAVDPKWQRHGIATRLLVALAREALVRGAQHMTLEVRMSNKGAQDLYRRFGFAPVGLRKNYYPVTNEDALVMWVHDVDTPEYAELLTALEARVPGETRNEAKGR